MRLRFLLFLLLFFSCENRGINSISSQSLSSHVKILASDAFAGRETGTEGIRKAAEYIRGELEKYGITPLPEKDYYLYFNLEETSFSAHSSLKLYYKENTWSLLPETHFKPLSLSGTGNVSGEIIFAGFGISAPEYNYDDYAGLDVRNKIVLVLRHEPFRFTNSQSKFTNHSFFKNKIRAARDRGAAGLIAVTDPLSSRSDDLRFNAVYTLADYADKPWDILEAEYEDFPVLHISQDIINLLFLETGMNLPSVQYNLNRGIPPADIPFPSLFTKVNVEKEKKITETFNIGGRIKAEKENGTERYIIIAAHYDHLGSFPGSGDTIYNGADDNASGTAGVLELARAFSGSGKTANYSLVFLFLSAEELGLLGSNAFLKQKHIDPDKIALTINLDMIGRNPDKRVNIYSYEISKPLADIINRVQRDIDIYYTPHYEPYYSYSDDYMFHKEDILTLFFYTGEHEDYHKVSDHWDTLDYERMEKIIRYIYRIIAGINEEKAL